MKHWFFFLIVDVIAFFAYAVAYIFIKLRLVFKWRGKR
jgi:hypothetical protein